MNQELYSKRLYAALAVSCLLHAALVFMPYLGATTIVSRLAMRGPQRPGPARILDVRLEAEPGPATTLAGTSVASANAAESAAGRMVNQEPTPAMDRSLGTGLLPIPAPGYYTADQLTKRPRPISDPSLDVPQTAPNFGSGKVVLKVWINDLGRVVSVDVEETDVPEAVAAKAAADFGRLRFYPAELNGRPVGALMRIEITYDEEGRQQ